MRIFLDVGANTGQTLAAVLEPIYRFDRIVCFEPTTICWEKFLDKIAITDPRVRIERFGLWNQTCETLIHEPGRKGGSMWKKEKSQRDTTELCQFRRASEWFAENIAVNDIVFLKLNCEGAECDILDDLLDSGEFNKVAFMMVDFDVRKIASQKHREADLRSRLNQSGIQFPRLALAQDVMIGPTHQDRIKNWLRLIGAQC